MPFSIRALFRRYCDHHLWISRPGFALFGYDGQPSGYIDVVHYGVSSVQIDGWTTCSSVSFCKPGAYDWSEPDIDRRDVAASLGAEHAKSGFQRQVSVADEAAMIAIRDGKMLATTPVLPLPRSVVRLAKTRLFIRFAWDCFVSGPILASYLFAPSLHRRQRAKRALRMVDTAQNSRLDLDVTQRGAAVLKPDMVTIIVPVFNALEILQECLERVVANTDVQWRMIVVEDCSTDSSVRPWVSRWADRQCAIGHDVQVVLNETNLGFIGSVNRAFDAARRYSDHVILLNSDALVPPNWAGRLLHPICSNTKVASVTPMSNDAEIMNAPVACRAHTLPVASVDAIDAGIAARISVQAWAEVPTGVGFCMAINAGFLRKLDRFDPIFGKGYGEEVDWCQKARGLGGVHAAQPALFVEHKGGASFGNSVKTQAIKKNNALVSARYPGFDRDVQNFLADDPLRTPRMIHAMSFSCATQERVPVFIAHSMGGGAELYLKEQIDGLVSQGLSALVLRVGGTELWGIEHYSPMGCLCGSVSTNADVMRLLEGWPNLDVIYSCGVGHMNPKSLPALLAALSRLPSRQLVLLVHDYFCLSEAYTLLDGEGRFSGINPLGVRDKIWRSAWREALTASDEIRCFSKSSRHLVTEAFPECAEKIRVIPHQIPPHSKVTASGKTGPIGVLGDIGAQKGAAIVSRLTRRPTGIANRRIVIVGRLDPAFACGALGDQTGPYKRDQIAEIAQRKKLSCWLIPSIWPETFSYTTHEALATGLPVFVFDIGGQAEAARAALNGNIMPISWAHDPSRVAQFINGVLTDVADGGSFDQRPERRRRRGFAA